MNGILLLLIAVALIWIQCRAGGTRLIYSIPPYLWLSIAGVLSAFARRKATGPTFVCLAGSALFFGYVLVRACLSPIGYLWWSDFLMVLACLILYLLVGFYLTSSEDRGTIAVLLLFIGLAEFAIGLRQFAFKDDFMLFGFTRAHYGWRASGFYVSSISLAGYLEVMALLALSLACWSRWPVWSRGAMAYLAATFYVGVGITGSRGGYISSAVSLVAFAVLSLYHVRRLSPENFGRVAVLSALSVAGFFAGAIGLMSLNPDIRARLDTIPAQLTKGGLDVRIYNWEAALDQFRLSPWLGTGAGTHLVYGRLFRRPTIQHDPEHAHNDYLELLAEYGVAGAVLMGGFLFVHIRAGFRSLSTMVATEVSDRYRERDCALALQIAALSALVAYLAHSVVDFNLHIPANALLFAILFGILANGDPRPSVGQKEGAARLFRFALPLLGASVIYFGFPKLDGEKLTNEARTALSAERFTDAIDLAQRAISKESANWEAFYILGEGNRAVAGGLDFALKRNAFYEAAVAAYRDELKIFPQDDFAYAQMGRALDGVGRFGEAADAYRRAIDLDPNLGILHEFYAAHLRTVGRSEEADEEYEKGLRLAEKDLTSQMDSAAAAARKLDK